MLQHRDRLRYSGQYVRIQKDSGSRVHDSSQESIGMRAMDIADFGIEGADVHSYVCAALGVRFAGRARLYMWHCVECGI
jgi:hypothetical protein